MCGRLGVVTLVALSLVLAALSVEAKPGERWRHGPRPCPQKKTTFFKRIKSCFNGLNIGSPVVDMAEHCSQIKNTMKCLKNWKIRCSNRTWMAKLQEFIDISLKTGNDAIRVSCPAA